MALGGLTIFIHGNAKKAQELFTQSLEIFRSLGHRLYEARALTWLAVAQTDQQEMIRYSEESLAVARNAGDKIDMLISLSNLADIAISNGNLSIAESYCREAIMTADEMQSRIISTHTKTLLSLVHFLNGDWDIVMDLVNEGLSAARYLNNGMAIGYAEGFSGFYEAVFGNPIRGKQLAEDSINNPSNHGLGLMIAHLGLAAACCALQIDDPGWMSTLEALRLSRLNNTNAILIWISVVMAVFLHLQERTEEAIKLIGLANAHPFGKLGWTTKWETLQKIQDELEQEIRTYSRELKSLSPTEIFELLLKTMDEIQISGNDQLEVPDSDSAIAANQNLVDPLTNREMQVLQLIAEGLSNRQIAEELVITTGTVKYYTSNIYRKLQAGSRTQAVALARELGIIIP
jgi:LuxR family maltose regulon positive regulatory protein